MSQRAVSYTRVSTADQVDGHSLAAQERLFQELCRNRGWIASGVYREEGKSAHTDSVAKRPVFRKLLDDAAAHQFDIVVVHTLDRFSRNLKVMLEALASLSRANVSLVSITEQVDYSTPQGRLFIQMLGSFAEYFSSSLAKHVSKGQSQRAHEGRHLGGIPFAYESCWTSREGQRLRVCDPEHPGGVHQMQSEAAAVVELFRKYSTGTATTTMLAEGLNAQGLRTRNTKSLSDGSGRAVAGPRLFTSSSVRIILRNPFYRGDVKYNGELVAGKHDALISPGLFGTVQSNLTRNSGRSMTLSPAKTRDYTLRGLVHCAWCGRPLWAQTLVNGLAYYREKVAGHGYGECPAGPASIRCAVPDEQVGRLVAAIELCPDWRRQVMEKISLHDEVARIKRERQRTEERLKRLSRVYLDGSLSDADYEREKVGLNMQLRSLVIPEMNAAEEAARLIGNLPELWAKAEVRERRDLLVSLLDGVYIDMKETRSVVGIRPKAAFAPLFQAVTTAQGSGVELVRNTQPPAGEPGAADWCLWWRRGRVELPVQKGFCGTSTSVAGT